MVVGVAAHKVVVAGPLFVRIELASTVSADVLFPCQACKGAFNDFGRPAVFFTNFNRVHSAFVSRLRAGPSA